MNRKPYCATEIFRHANLAFSELELSSSFTYLGVVLTTRLASSKHVDSVVSKAGARIGYLFSALPLSEVPLPVALKIFNTYILPIITYALPTWQPNLTEATKKKLNALFTKFLKRYLGLPYNTNNAIVHFLTGTVPLTLLLSKLVHRAALRIMYPSSVSGVLTDLPPPPEDVEPYNPVPLIPPYFWLSTPLDGELPLFPETRRALLYEVVGVTHFHLCKTNEFHLELDDSTCICRLCNEAAPHYHHRECPHLQGLSA